MKLSIIICCYDEAPVLKNSWKRLKKVLPNGTEVIFVNDGSTDRTYEIIEHEIKYIPKQVYSYAQNRGYGHALKQGLRLAKGNIILMDADMSMDPKQVLQTCITGLNEHDMIICSRYKGIQPNYPFKRRFFSRCYYLLNRVLIGTPYRDTQSGFVGFKKKVLRDINLKSNDFSILLELISKVHFTHKYSIKEIPMKFKHKIKSGETSIIKNSPKMLWNSFRIWYDIWRR